MGRFFKNVTSVAVCLLAASACTVDIGGDTLEDSNSRFVGISVKMFEAEDRTAQYGCIEKLDHEGFTGSGYMEYGGDGTWVEWKNIHAAQAGKKSLTFRYANGVSGNRQAEILVNGQKTGDVPFAPTGAWTEWKTVSLTVMLRKGDNTIRVKANTEDGGPNLDHLVVASNSP